MKSCLSFLLLAVSAYVAVDAAFGPFECELEGEFYEVGTKLPTNCGEIFCSISREGKPFWFTDDKVNSKCDRCCLWNDPHIRTFDRADSYYNWHGTCRYSLARHVENWDAINPKSTLFGVYGDFRPCGAKAPPSCLNTTSYQLIDNLAYTVHVRNSDLYRIWNADFSRSVSVTSKFPEGVVIGRTTYPVLAWKKDNCLRLSGPDVMVQVCASQVCIWAHARHIDHLGGLCGKYNDNWKDDHTDIHNVRHEWETNPTEFPRTWLTPVQFDCDLNNLPPVHKSRCQGAALRKSKAECKAFLRNCEAGQKTLQKFINTCSEDLCFLPNDKQKWLANAGKICNEEVTIQNDEGKEECVCPPQPNPFK